MFGTGGADLSSARAPNETRTIEIKTAAIFMCLLASSWREGGRLLHALVAGKAFGLVGQLQVGGPVLAGVKGVVAREHLQLATEQAALAVLIVGERLNALLPSKYNMVNDSARL